MKSLIKFDKQSVSYQILHDMGCRGNFKISFNYLANKLGLKKLGDLSKMKWSEGKNYKWLGIKSDNLNILIRGYRNHFTIYFKNVTEESYFSKYGCFIFSTNSELLSDEESDKRCGDNYLDLNQHIGKLIDFIKKDKVHSLWNNCSYERESYIEIKNVWNGGDDISNLEDFIFAIEELSSKFVEVFAENDMIERIKTIKVGDVVGGHKVKDIVITSKDNYFHGIGLDVEGHYFMDVYFLTRWELDELFDKETQENFDEKYMYLKK